MLKRFSICLLQGLAIIGCVSYPKRDYKFIALPEVINEDPDKKLTPEMVKYDIDQALFALDKGYSGRLFLPKGQYSRLITEIKRIDGAMSAKELCAKIDSQMDQVSDNHLSAKLNGKSCFQSPNSKSGSVGKNIYTKQKPPWFVQRRRIEGIDTLLISITSFASSQDPAWNGFLEEVKARLQGAEVIVLDFRGNGGGDDHYGNRLSELLAGGSIPSPYLRQWMNPHPEASQIFVNAFQHWANLMRKDGVEVPQYILGLIKQFEEKRELAIKGEVPKSEWRSLGNDEAKPFDPQKAVKQPIYILLDADCVSSCESATDFFENNPNVTTVGENTAGFVHFGNAGTVILKNSGVELRIPISYNEYKDKRFIEKVGITPKIQVEPGGDALKAALNHFSSRRKK